MSIIDHKSTTDVNVALEQFLLTKKETDYIHFVKLYSEYFNSHFFDKIDLSKEEIDVLKMTMMNGLLRLMDKSYKNPHPLSYPFLHFIQQNGKKNVEFSKLFMSTLGVLTEQNYKSMMDQIYLIYKDYIIIPTQLSEIQYHLHYYCFRYDNENYLYKFLNDFTNIIPTDKIIKMYDDVLSLVPGFNEQSIKKQVLIYKEAISAKKEYNTIKENFNIGKIQAAIAIEKLFRVTLDHSKSYYDLNLHKTCSDILKPHILQIKYKNKTVEYLSFIKEFSNLNLMKMIEHTEYDKLRVLLPFLPQGLVDKLFNHIVNHGNLKMVKTFLNAGAAYLTPEMYDDDGVVGSPKRDMNKTNYNRELLNKTITDE